MGSDSVRCAGEAGGQRLLLPTIRCSRVATAAQRVHGDPSIGADGSESGCHQAGRDRGWQMTGRVALLVTVFGLGFAVQPTLGQNIIVAGIRSGEVAGGV